MCKDFKNKQPYTENKKLILRAKAMKVASMNLEELYQFADEVAKEYVDAKSLFYLYCAVEVRLVQIDTNTTLSDVINNE